MEYVAAAATIAGAVGSISAGQAQAEALESQMVMGNLRARSEALNYRYSALNWKREGIKNLQETNINIHSINARAAAGGLDPYTGSIGNIMTQNLSEGLLDYDTAVNNYIMDQENAVMVQEMAKFQAGIHMAAASTAKQKGYFDAAMYVGQGAAQGHEAGWFK